MKNKYKVKSKLTDEVFYVETSKDGYIYRGEFNNIIFDYNKIGIAKDQPFMFTGISYLRNYYTVAIAVVLAPVGIPMMYAHDMIVNLRNKLVYNA